MPGSRASITNLRVFRDDPLSGERRVVLDGVTLAVDAGKRLALVGPNGAGKTSLLLALVGALSFEGTITLGGEALGKKTLAQLRRRTGFVFAEPADQLFSTTVLDEAEFGPLSRGQSESAARERARAALASVKLDSFEARAPGSLSLGEQRRLAIATALACEPELLLLDEPTSSLDGRARRAVLDAIRTSSSTLVLATHDLEAALELDATTALFRDGHLIGVAPAAAAFRDTELLDRAGLDPPAGRAFRE